MVEAFGRRKRLCLCAHPFADHGHSYCQPNSPSLNWSSLQPLLETAVPHVLIILDCCFAASAARDTTEGTTKEILAACGRESPTLGVGQRSFTSALIEEMQAFDGAPFTATMLHSRLVTMRWRLAFTPIYALLSERGGNSITICPLLDDGASTRPESQLLAELEATEPSQQGQASITSDDPPSLQASQQQTVDTRVLLSVSVLQDAIPNISHWVSWLTTAAPWDVTGVDVKVESIFRSCSALILVSIPTYAWSRLPERPAYRFVGFIRSGDMFQAAKNSTPLITETLPRAVASPFPADELLHPIDKAGATLNPTDWQDEFLISPEVQSSRQRRKRQRTDVVPEPAAEMPRHFAGFPVSEASKSPSTAGLDLGNTPKRKSQPPIWAPEDDELLVRARRIDLNWQSIAVKYFPHKTANACRKRHERLERLKASADKVENIDIDKLSKAYLESREHMWRLLADRVGEDWQAVEAKVRGYSIDYTRIVYEYSLIGSQCMGKGLDKELGRTTSRSGPSFDPLAYLDDEDHFEDSAIGVDDFSHNALGSSEETLYDGPK